MWGVINADYIHAEERLKVATHFEEYLHMPLIRKKTFDYALQ